MQEVAEVVKDYVDGATLTLAMGIWHGEVETSTVVTMVLSPLEGDRNITYWLTSGLRDRLHQDCVLVTMSEVESTEV